MKKYYKFFIVLLVISFIVPQVAFASWWNPFSWNVWGKIFHVFSRPQTTITETPPPSNDLAPTIENNAPIEINDNLKKQTNRYNNQVNSRHKF